jgi:hypothetical protein
MRDIGIPNKQQSLLGKYPDINGINNLPEDIKIELLSIGNYESTLKVTDRFLCEQYVGGYFDEFA